MSEESASGARGEGRLVEFDIDLERGFLPSEDPLGRLPGGFEAWEEAAQGLPKLLVAAGLRERVRGLPAFPVERLAGERELRRAMVLLSYVGHAYVWGEHEPATSIPAVLAVPWHAVGERLGRPPVLSYASYALDNWRRIDPDGPIALGNIALLQNFLGGVDEEWFILIHVDIEARAAPAMRGCLEAQAAVAAGDAAGVERALTAIHGALEEMYRTMVRMPERCDPYIYYRRVRPYIHGWKNNPSLPDGIVYEGVEEYGGAPQQLRGETGAQSSIVPALDAVLGVAHKDDPLKAYLLEMRDYMPPRHRAFIAALEAGPSLRKFVRSRRAGHGRLMALYNDCVLGVERFRALHLEYAARYIFKQAQTERSNPSDIGTGGTPFMRYLKKHRDETAKHAV